MLTQTEALKKKKKKKKKKEADALERHIYAWRRAILVQSVLVVALVAAQTLMPEQQRVPLQQALSVLRRLKQRTTEAVRSNARMAWRCSGNTNEELVRNLESEFVHLFGIV
ncbi:unnamed protein product [Heligmosomoides polygyrus]|uniref:NR LBD domain-containing protein n=1 Tax=Heligmosomoides polygyrus TaxID=6339 RepID=A0A183FMA1_HELPZ|nr:unnamed protein product [Heligmosomoides polygyrus]